MVKGALFVSWGDVIPGREKAARLRFSAALQYCARMQEEGKIDTFEVVGLEPHGGDLAGFILVKGDRDALAQLRSDTEFVRMIESAQLVHTRVGVLGAYTGAEMESLVEIWYEQFEKLIQGTAT
jgi:hypothetical protein